MALSKQQIAQADVLAGLAQQAAKEIDQAGRALHVAIQHCASNTPDMKTVQIMATAAAYLNNAIMLVLEGLAGAEIQEAQKPGTGLVLPTSAL